MAELPGFPNRIVGPCRQPFLAAGSELVCLQGSTKLGQQSCWLLAAAGGPCCAPGPSPTYLRPIEHRVPAEAGHTPAHKPALHPPGTAPVTWLSETAARTGAALLFIGVGASLPGSCRPSRSTFLWLEQAVTQAGPPIAQRAHDDMMGRQLPDKGTWQGRQLACDACSSKAPLSQNLVLALHMQPDLPFAPACIHHVDRESHPCRDLPRA